MHYCVHLITKTLPTEKEIDEIMKPYKDDNIEDLSSRVFTWDWWSIGGRYGGRIKLKVDMEDEEYRWKFYSLTPREGRLFHSSLLAEIRERFPSYKSREEDWFVYLGVRDNYLCVDGAKIKDIINLEELGCYICIDIDGSVIARGRWNEEDFIEDKDFDKKYEEILSKSQDYFLTILDIHD